ncbi:hypothetical protein HDU67_004084 [Dinochytrium kinnereticum]|nr:hypothetical protein HDU67_004084 [Dinochytrium kinnereticum]
MNISRIFRTNPLIQRFSKSLQHKLGIGSNFMSVIMFITLLLLFLHFNACLIAILKNGEARKDRSLAEEIEMQALQSNAMYFGVQSGNDITFTYDKNEPIWSKYALFFLASTANGLSVSGYDPTNRIEQIFHSILAIVGSVIYALVVGAVASFSMGLDAAGKRYREKLDEVNEFMDEAELPETLRAKIQNFFMLKYRGKYFDKGAIMSELNHSLQSDILLESLREFLGKVPFFHRNESDGRDNVFVCRLAEIVAYEYFVAGNNVFVQGQKGHDMYFILQGTADIIVNGNKVGGLGEGSFFGEVALIDSAVRSATIQASSHLVLIRLGKADLNPILDDVDV